MVRRPGAPTQARSKRRFVIELVFGEEDDVIEALEGSECIKDLVVAAVRERIGGRYGSDSTYLP